MKAGARRGACAGKRRDGAGGWLWLGDVVIGEAMRLGVATGRIGVMAFGVIAIAVFTSAVGLAQVGHAKGAKESKSAKAEVEKTHQRIGSAPDPAPIRSRTQWEITLVYRRGDVEVSNWRKVHLAQPIATVRRMGRFAVELLSGEQVVERVRFNFPMLGAESTDTTADDEPGYFSPPRLQDKATTSYRLMVPDTERASRLRVVDRATGKHITLRWPPRTGQGIKPPVTAAQSQPGATSTTARKQPTAAPATKLSQPVSSTARSQPGTASATARKQPTAAPATKLSQPVSSTAQSQPGAASATARKQPGTSPAKKRNQLAPASP